MLDQVKLVFILKMNESKFAGGFTIYILILQVAKHTFIFQS